MFSNNGDKNFFGKLDSFFDFKNTQSGNTVSDELEEEMDA